MAKRLLIALLLGVASLSASLPASASNFSLTDTGGKVRSLSDYRGKWLLVNLWATWCANCLTEMPELQALSMQHPELAVLGIAVDEPNPNRVARFADKLHVTYPVIAASDDVAKSFKPRGVPTTILFDPRGNQVLVKEGPVTRAEVESAMAARGAN